MSQHTLLLATTSAGKTREIKDILAGMPLQLLSLSQISLPTGFRVVESGDTFATNAQLKAQAYGAASGLLTLADDSGLCVDALGGRPGVLTARYAAGSDQDRWQKLLQDLKGIPKKKRTAQFVSVAALYQPKTEKIVLKKGICRGRIAFAPKGKQGFGYDPVFVVEALGKHFAQLTRPEKNQVSHRAKAIRKLRPVLKEILHET